MRRWTLESAKTRLGEIIRRATADGPQFVTEDGRDAVVVMSVEEYARLGRGQSLVQFLSTSPLAAALAKGALELDGTGEPANDRDR